MKFIEPPIIVYDPGDVIIYECIKDVTIGLEAIDILNGNYTAYDSNGRLLKLIVDPTVYDSKGNLIRLKDVAKGIQIEATEDFPSHEKELKDILHDYLLELGINSLEVKDVNLASLINLATKYSNGSLRATKY